MVASETSIANAALTLLGEKRVNSIASPTSKLEKLMAERYSDVRDELLRMHPWNFATKRESLAADVDTPEWGFDLAYTFPADLLRLLKVNNPGGEVYRVEGRKIITNLGAPLEIEYTALVSDPLEMDIGFRQCLAAALAFDVAESITGDSGKVEEISAIYQQKLRNARFENGQEPSPPEIESSEWINAREEGTSLRRVPVGGGTPL